mgnify:CR=1 FL=1
MNTYFEILLEINPEMEDIISEFCFENLPCEGVVLAEEAYKDLEMTSTTRGSLKIFLTEKPKNIENIFNDYRQILLNRGFSKEELGTWNLTISENENQDWSKKWKEKWDITRVTDKIVVVPDWLEYTEKPEEIVIRLEPGCAFGTGTHATTQLCMKALEIIDVKDKNVADIGTGSGILAICAKKFGAKYVYGCDNDDTVIDVAIENAQKNNSKCDFELGTADKITKKYDFVMANILHNVLFEIMEDLQNITVKGGYIALSGILNEKAPIVLEAIKRCNLEIIKELHQDQWVGFIVKNI